MLEKGGAAIKEMAQETDSFGTTLSKQSNETLENYSIALEKTTKRADGMRIAVAGIFAGDATKGLNAFEGYLKGMTMMLENSPKLGGAAADYSQKQEYLNGALRDGGLNLGQYNETMNQSTIAMDALRDAAKGMLDEILSNRKDAMDQAKNDLKQMEADNKKFAESSGNAVSAALGKFGMQRKDMEEFAGIIDQIQGTTIQKQMQYDDAVNKLATDVWLTKITEGQQAADALLAKGMTEIDKQYKPTSDAAMEEQKKKVDTLTLSYTSMKTQMEGSATAAQKISDYIKGIPTSKTVDILVRITQSGSIPGESGPPTLNVPASKQASGGDYIVSKPTLFMAGEAGTERAKFIPLNGNTNSKSDGDFMPNANFNVTNEFNAYALISMLRSL
jgi:hypothetical protein